MSSANFNLIHVDPSLFTKKRKRTGGACVACHERKVKCDGRDSPSSGRSCKNCSVAGLECRTHTDGRVRGNGGIRDKPNSSWELYVSARPSNLYHSRECETDAAHIRSYPADHGASEKTTLTPESLNSIGSMMIHESELPSDVTEEQVVAQLTETVRSTNDNHAVAGNELDWTGLAETIMPPTTRSPDNRPQASLDRFEAYIQDTLGHYAPSFSSQVTEGTNLTSSNTVFGVEPRVSRLEVEMALRPTVDLERQMRTLDAADMELLKAKGAFDLPPRGLQEELINAHFAEVHPTAPVINKTEFLSDFYSNWMPSRLLLFAILASGARACRNPALLDETGTVHGSAQRFYKATKALLDTGYESDKLKRIQALLLITWWWDKKDDGGMNMRSCVVDAINIAQSIGMHRWDHYPRNDPVTLGLWKRAWWSCFNRDVGVGVAHGLPTTLSLSDFDVPPLTPEDFNEEPNTPKEGRRYSHTEVEIQFFLEQTKVMEALHHIHREQFVTRRLDEHMTGSISQRAAIVQNNMTAIGRETLREWSTDPYDDEGLALCRGWSDQLPDILRYNVDDVRGHKFWPAFLHILYYTNIMLRFREKSVSKIATSHAIAEREYCQARGIAAATMVSKIVRNVKAHGQILRCTGQLTNSIFNCLIFFLIEGQSTNADVRRDAQQKYSLCLNVLYDFSQIWVSASLIHHLFETMQAHMYVPTKRSVSLLHGLLQSPLPGLSISSAITNTYMKQLLEAKFSYDDSSTGVPSLAPLSSTIERSTPLTQIVTDDVSFHFPQTAESGLPDSLDLDQWVNFFGFGNSDLDLAAPDFSE